MVKLRLHPETFTELLPPAAPVSIFFVILGILLQI
jgi:hypothetical protein